MSSQKYTLLKTSLLAVVIVGLFSKYRKSSQHVQLVPNPSMRQRIRILLILPIYYFAKLIKLPFQLCLSLNKIRLASNGIDDSQLADEKELEGMLRRIGGAGLRSTGSKAHNDVISWIEEELKSIPSLQVQTEEIELMGWQPEKSLCEAGSLTVVNQAGAEHEPIPIAGVVPYSLPVCGQTGSLVYVPQGVPLSNQDLSGKMILRDFPLRGIPYILGMLPQYHKTADLDADTWRIYERPGLADQPIHEDLLQAGRIGAAGVIFIFDLPRQQVESYWEPHKGTHYLVPAAYIGVDEGRFLKEKALEGYAASLSVDATTFSLVTRNLTGVLPGQTDERIIYITHTDGNTFVQENGPVALLALAKYFANQPLSSRRRTIEFAFNAGHLHISREGSLRHARQLRETFDRNNLALTIPVEHLGTREIEPVSREDNKIGRTLKFTGRGELMFWCAGPSVPVVKAVKKAVAQRKLDRVLITRGVSKPNLKSAPTFTSFGGIGTYYHNLLLPTTSLISGPWSLWAPEFGIEAIDIRRLRQQISALGDVFAYLDCVPKEAILGDYACYHKDGWKSVPIESPPEQASEHDESVNSNVKY
jgi:hypothetical protein